MGQITQCTESNSAQPVQLCAHPWYGIERKPCRQTCLDAIDRGYEEVARPHRDVGASEVEERLSQAGLVVLVPQPVEVGQVCIQGRRERLVQQVVPPRTVW